MKNDKSQFVVRTSDFYLSLVIGHWSLVICHLILAWLQRIFLREIFALLALFAASR